MHKQQRLCMKYAANMHIKKSRMPKSLQ